MDNEKALHRRVGNTDGRPGRKLDGVARMPSSKETV